MKRIIAVIALLTSISCGSDTIREVYNGENLTGLWYRDSGDAYGVEAWKIPHLVQDENSEVTITDCSSLDAIPPTFTKANSTLEGYPSFTIEHKSKMVMHLENDDGPDDFNFIKVSDSTEFQSGKIQFDSNIEGSALIESNVCAYSAYRQDIKVVIVKTYFQDRELSVMFQFTDEKYAEYDLPSDNATVIFGASYHEREYGYENLQVKNGQIDIEESSNSKFRAKFNGTWLSESGTVTGFVDVDLLE